MDKFLDVIIVVISPLIFGLCIFFAWRFIHSSLILLDFLKDEDPEIFESLIRRDLYGYPCRPYRILTWRLIKFIRNNKNSNVPKIRELIFKINHNLKGIMILFLCFIFEWLFIGITLAIIIAE